LFQTFLVVEAFVITYRFTNMLTGRKKIVGSSTGGLREYQEMLDFSAKHNILCDTEVISIDYLSTAMERIRNLDVKYRFAIDIGNTLKYDE
jgi:D-arabinose 1-dehydrogenase-like Zn-dependent alcohol dehydrogenase